MMKKTLAELADYLDGRLIGNENDSVTGVAGIETAGPEEAAFLLDEYASFLAKVQAGLILMENEPENTYGKNILVVENPKLAFAKLIHVFSPPPVYQEGIHQTAIVDPTAHVDDSASIGAYAIIGPRAEIGAKTVIHPHVVVESDCQVGMSCEIHAGVILHAKTQLGDRVIVRGNAVIGGEGFGFATEDGKHTRLPQIGRVVIGDDVEIGACCTIDNATFGETSIGRGTKLDNLVHLGHNVQIGEDCFIISQVGIAGSTKIGNHCVLAGQTGVTGHVTIADHVTCGGKTGVIGNITEPGTYVGYPARPHRQWGRIEGALTHLPELMKRVKRIEKALADKLK